MFTGCRIFLVVAVVLHGMSSPAFSQGGLQASGLTAQEFLDQGSRLYLDGKYAEAIQLFQEFESSFGKSEEAKPLLRGIRYRWAMALVQLKKFDEAIPAIETALAVDPPLQKREIEELTFWLGVSNLEEENFEEARAALGKFIGMFPAGAERQPFLVQQSPDAIRIPEARLLIGTSWLLEDKFREAANYFAGLPAGSVPEDRGRTVVLRLYALLQAGDNEAATKLVEQEFPRMGDFAQMVSFQTLVLELGNRWLEQGEYRKAMACLQRVWTADRLLRHQESRLEDLQSRLEAAEANPRGDPYTKMVLGQLVRKVERELENFRKITSFDAALRLRLATAYQALGRYREAALIMEDMLAKMPPDKLVEQASVNLAQAWYEIERWPNVNGAAAAFVEKFPQSASIPLVLYLSGLAAQQDTRFDLSVAEFDRILKEHPESDFAPRALFMRGFTQLLAENNPDAIRSFEDVLKKYPDHELTESAGYWRGMGYSLDKQFERAREVLAEYQKKYPDGSFSGAAAFRRAYCAQQMEDFTTSIRELRAYLREFPGHENAAEARILLGDALMNEGEMEEGIAAFKGIPRDQTRFYEEGVFKTGKALKLMEEHGRLLELMTTFEKENPRSPRVAEAVFQIGWVHRQAGEPEKARDVYWAAIEELGDDPSIRSVEDLFPGLQRLYRGEDAEVYLTRLRDMEESARASGKTTLLMRTLWAQAAAMRKSNPAAANALLTEAASLANVQTANPLLLADIATALAESGKRDDAARLWRDLVKWNPRAPQKDRALAALGFMELEAGNDKAALDFFQRFQRETPASRETGRVQLARAALLERRGRDAEARQALEDLLASEYSTGEQKAEALYRIGDSHLRAGKPTLAIPYFQRIYVMHGRWKNWVGRAYLASGQAFEKIDDTGSARRTYQEFTEREDFADLPEFQTAKERLQTLGGPVAESAPNQG
ncbi:MAG: tetratricopeptide repeat protein [Terrimicrobiaceae bacterium]|nr:tetratricopeptide repeat protein [Terrimicrobiaceae bacterium]